MVNVLAAGIEKLTGDSESVGKLKSLQMNDVPELFADADDIPYRQDMKRDLWVPCKGMPCSFLQAIHELRSTNMRWHAGYSIKPVARYAQILTILPILLGCQGQAKLFNFICSNHGF